MHITNLFTSTAFTFDTLGHCPMALTLKTKINKISQQNFKYIIPLLQYNY